jgi:signal transduction histidine kinase
VADRLPDPLLLLSAGGAVVAANEPARERLGRDAVAGVRLEDLVSTPAPQVARLLAAAARNTAPIPGVLAPRGSSERLRCEASRVGTHPVHGELVLLRCWGRDERFELLTRKIDQLNEEVLERRRAEAEREALIDKLAQALRVMETFVGILGHDLRNPLAAITSATALALRRGPPPPLSRDLERIARSAGRMARMIDQLLDVTRLRLGKGLAVQRCAGDLAEVARHCVAELQEAHPGRTIAVEVAGAVGGSWDADRLGQVVSNLVGNALQHAPPGAPVRVLVDGRDAHVVELRVHNPGPRIPPERVEALFDAFSAGDRSQGLGLGLYITREIARAHGGDVRVESSDAGGTTFVVTLPRQPAALPVGASDGVA